ncbi:bifunctional lysylphosphatidylglycerol flippase/synthetase MprF [Tomitella biformata]|uniref:bifunctional lysylphosphatidylglycerol flippase/synthetase MprF n=1 Tax=Tomitella biformata TaxID=630403 RepID=UPI0004B7067E|nr:phosphatidylglycerol lysyltransferase domain-containing protein [Tomitella biformata]
MIAGSGQLSLARRYPLAVRVLVLVVAAMVFALAVARSSLWLAAAGLATLIVARGVCRNRPLTAVHTLGALFFVGIAFLAHQSGHQNVLLLALVAAGVTLVAPRGSSPEPRMMPRIAELVERTPNDPLAPFTMHSAKSYFFDSTGTVALGYRARLGIAAVGGDPIGDPARFAAAIDEFVGYCRGQGWSVAVLGAGEAMVAHWRTVGMRALAIGRDVVLDVDTFTLVGRKNRNLRQAVSRSHNYQLTTEVRAEADLTAEQRAELMGIVAEAHGGEQDRGFSMILDHLLDGRHPGLLVAICRDPAGRALGFQRYGVADGGRMITMDVPWRRPDAPSGVDERLTIDMVEYARQTGGKSLSLAFAPFPELFEMTERTPLQSLAYRAVRLLDPMIAVASLYQFLKKFNALGERRYALYNWHNVALVLIVFLTLEFVPHRKRP